MANADAAALSASDLVEQLRFSSDEASLLELPAVARAEYEYAKFEKVEGLLEVVGKYMAVYHGLVEGGGLVVVGSKGDSEPRHALPEGLDAQAWSAMAPEAQYAALVPVAESTRAALDRLLSSLASKFPHSVEETSLGPTKAAARSIEKTKNDYGGDMLRVIDLTRSSAVLVLDKLSDIATVVQGFEDGGFLSEEWSFVRTKDGFANPDNFLSGGYRDVKLNIRFKPNGHVVEVQFHLRPYYAIKQGEGHHFYAFARTLKVDGVTSAVSVLTDLNESLMAEICAVGERRLEAARKDAPDDFELLGRLELRLGALYSALWQHGKQAVLFYDAAVQSARQCQDRRRVCDALVELAYCVSEMQRHHDRPNMNSDDPKWMTVDNRPWVEEALVGYKELLGDYHPSTLKAQRVQADVVNEHEDKAQAQLLYRRVLEQQTSVLGTTHPDTIETLNNFGDFLTELFEETEDAAHVEEGVGCYEKGLEGALKRMGPTHPTSRMLLGNIIASLEEHADTLQGAAKKLETYTALHNSATNQFNQ